MNPGPSRQFLTIMPETTPGAGEAPLTFEALRTANLDRCERAFYPLHSWSPSDWATALAGETGETCNLIKKMRRGDAIDLAEVGKELADVVMYADLLATRLGLDLGDCVRAKFNEISDRVGSDIRL